MSRLCTFLSCICTHTCTRLYMCFPGDSLCMCLPDVWTHLLRDTFPGEKMSSHLLTPDREPITAQSKDTTHVQLSGPVSSGSNSCITKSQAQPRRLLTKAGNLEHAAKPAGSLRGACSAAQVVCASSRQLVFSENDS